MSKPVKRVLLTNDDGWRGPGLGVLEEIAREIAEEVWVISPDLDQSGVSMSISLHQPLRVHTFDPQRFSVSGTPSDCVMLGVSELMPEPPDLVLSGVNCGANISDSVAYSGTIGGALTATLLNIPAIALSQAYHKGSEVHWDTSRRYGAEIVRQLLAKGWPTDCAMNINFPARPADQVTGVALCRARAGSIAGINIESRRDTRDVPYYWLGFQRQAERISGLDTDVGALRAGRISISPLRFEREIANWQLDGNQLAEALGIQPQDEDAADGALSLDH
ncbi:5'/3'-nucleotidase SurE [Halopseudomonas yangmingensis]|uniref:5'-nucleotidase SurE n=1 Tax=Halopseudomonas yangmingensis TaxID=1720063 RepID=A0A1I4S9R1_9GAMM|nr:5'/3'-nucleotidase SurE [Halopseudomonas yangmingensis]SFM61225.1 5'-nucleotidase /3'-nucleotidase /exopolyphosphatase [Halopseudomonas yangmingensis]